MSGGRIFAQRPQAQSSNDLAAAPKVAPKRAREFDAPQQWPVANLRGLDLSHVPAYGPEGERPHPLDSARRIGAELLREQFERSPWALANRVQAKLEVGAVDGPLEQEADRVASEVVSGTNVSATTSTEQNIQRKCATCEAEEKADTSMQRKAVDAAPTAAAGASTGVQHVLQSPGRPLDASAREFMEPRFGHDFGEVRIHDDARAHESADAVQARAYTVGHDVVFGDGEYRPETIEGRALLAHELTHVVQQSRTAHALQRKLKITGTPGNVSRTMSLLRSGLFGYQISADASGNVSITRSATAGAPSATQQALADRLSHVIDDPHDVNMTVSAGSRTVGGSYQRGDFDISDLETYGVAGLIHEIEEQYQKQVKGQAFGPAHSEALKAESEVRGARRGTEHVVSSTANPDGTIDAVIEIPHTFPDGSVKTMIMTVRHNDIVSVTWRES